MVVLSAGQILERLPYGEAFRFVDEILEISQDGIGGCYTYDSGLFFYDGHFRGFPVTPAAILTETMAQIGLVCLGIYLMGGQVPPGKASVAMTSSSLDFLKPVYPGEKVFVTGTKNYFRFNKLSCKVQMHDAGGELIAKGTISGMLISRTDESGK